MADVLVNRTEWNRAAGIDAAADRTRRGNIAAMVMLIICAAPGTYTLVFLLLEICLSMIGFSIRNLPLYREAEGLFLFYTLPLGWFGTPLALTVLAARWRRFGGRGRRVGAVVCGLAAAGVWFSSLYFPFQWVFDRWSVH